MNYEEEARDIISVTTIIDLTCEDAKRAKAEFVELIVQALKAERQAALEEAAQIAERYQENYPEDIFTTNGTSVDAQSARCMRIASDNIAAEIRRAAEKTGVGLHASQQPHATDAATAPRG